MDPIPVQWLYSFVVFAESASMSEAAQRIGVTQPALSKQLKSLGEALPQDPFMQSGKRKVLTPFGQALHENLRSRLANLSDVVVQTSHLFAKPEEAEIRIAARREILDRLSAHLRFAGRLIFLEQSHEEILHSLKERSVDIGITHAAPDTHELVAKVLFRERFQVAVPKKLARQKPEANPGEVLRKIPTLAYKLKDDVLIAASSSLGLKTSDLNIARVTANYASLAKMVEAGLGWTVLPAYLKLSPDKAWTWPLPARNFGPREFKVLFRPEQAHALWFKSLLGEMASGFDS